MSDLAEMVVLNRMTYLTLQDFVTGVASGLPSTDDSEQARLLLYSYFQKRAQRICDDNGWVFTDEEPNT